MKQYNFPQDGTKYPTNIEWVEMNSDQYFEQVKRGCYNPVLLIYMKRTETPMVTFAIMTGHTQEDIEFRWYGNKDILLDHNRIIALNWEFLGVF